MEWAGVVLASTTVKDGYAGGSDNQLKVNSDGSINTNTTGGGGSNASVGLTGVTAPTSGTEIAGIDPSGNLHGVSVDANGFLNVNGTSVVTGDVTTNQAGLDSFQTSQYAIGVTAVQLAPTPLTNRSSISITVEADPNVAVFIGNSNAVTISNGYPLYDGSTLQLDLTPTGFVWAICSVAGQTIAVLEIA